MKNFLFAFLFIINGTYASAAGMYIRSFGKSTDPALIFLHGGPGGTSIDFERNTAPVLARKGWFVIVYDRRGEGRSDADSARFTFEQTISDLNHIYTRFGISEAHLLGHSYGGIVGTLFARQYPQKVSSLVLLGAPVHLPQLFRGILHNVRVKLQASGDQTALSALNSIAALDSSSIEYSSACFMLAMQNRLYNTASPNAKARRLYKQLENDSCLKNYHAMLAQTQYKNMLKPVRGFWKNENYTTLNIAGELETLRKNGTKVYGIYGREDGLFDETHIRILKNCIGDDTHFAYLEHCSHGVFMDRQQTFTQLLKKWLR